MSARIIDFETAALKRDLANLEAEIDNYDSELWLGYDEKCLEEMEREFNNWEAP